MSGLYDRWVGLQPARILALFVGLSAVGWIVRIGAEEPMGFRLSLETLENPYFWLDVLNNLILVYLFAAHCAARRGALEDFDALRPVLDLDGDAIAERRERVATPSRLWATLAGLLFAGVLVYGPLFDDAFWAVVQPAPTLSPLMLLFLARFALTGWIAGQALADEIGVTREFACLGADHVRVDPLDLQPLEPFARKGLRSAALWLVASSLTSLFWLGPAVTAITGPIVAGVGALSLLVFLYPANAVSGAIRAAKEAKLDELRVRIRDEERRLASDASETSQLANWVSYYGLVESAREWPIEAPTVVRFGLFLVLGLGSWLGAALVERWLEQLVG